MERLYHRMQTIKHRFSPRGAMEQEVSRDVMQRDVGNVDVVLLQVVQVSDQWRAEIYQVAVLLGVDQLTCHVIAR